LKDILKESRPVSISRISANTNVYQSGNDQTSFGQLRNGFRRLLQSIKDGNLADAQQAYNNLTQTMPGVFQTLSSKLTDDYNAIGDALRVKDISGAQQAVVQLQQDLQGIGSAGNRYRNDQNLAGAPTPASTVNNIFRLYNTGHIDSQYIGTHIDIKI
jgi:hypothetical protein